ncbi:MAG: glycosyltransferase [Phormidesmis sp.]
MKVLHVIPSVSPLLGGPTHVALNIVKTLCEIGIDAEIVTTDDNREKLLDVPLYQRTFYKQVPIWFLPRYAHPLKEFIFSPAITRWLWQSVHHYDVLDTHYLFSYAPACANFIARHQQVPYTMRTMGQLSQWALEQSKLKKQLYSTFVERRLLGHAAAIHCTTPDEANDVQKFGIQTPTATVPLGVDVPSTLPNAKQYLRRQYSLPDNTFVIVFLSRLHCKKRPELLIQSLSRLVKNETPVHLLLAGTGDPDYVKELTVLVDSLNLNKYVTFTGFVQGKEKDLLLQGSSVFVLPSFSENFGVAIAEALAAGLPVITTPGVQISPEISAANAGLIVEGTEDELVRSIEILIDSTSLRHMLGENGRKLAKERYSWQVIAHQLASVYTTVIKNKRLPHSITF